MNKFLIVLILLSVLLVSGFSFSEMTAPLYENVKAQALSSFRSMFSEEVEIKEASGIIVGQIVLKGVKIGKDVEAEQVIINYNPLRYLAKKGDIVPAITSIKIKRGLVKILRKKDGEINFTKLLKQGDKGGPPQFRAKIYLVDCQAIYLDEAGMPYKTPQKLFETKIENLNGSLNLLRFPRVNLSASGIILKTTELSIKGWADLKRGDYDLKVVGKKMFAKDWGNYFSPYFDFKYGLFDLNLSLKPNNISLRAWGYANFMPFKLSGRVYNKLDLTISASNVNYKLIKEVFKESVILDYKGRGNVDLKISGPYENLIFSADLNVKEGEFYKQKISGKVSLAFQNNILTLKSSEIKAYNGKVSARGDMDFSQPSPIFAAEAEFKDLDLKEIAHGLPGIEGLSSGSLKLSGVIDGLEGELKARFEEAYLLGQSVQSCHGKFTYIDQELELGSLMISADQSLLLGSGKISPKGEVDLKTQVGGIRLSGEGVLGYMQADISSFEGEVAFSLDESFFKSPLKNLFAKGQVEAVNVQVGEQLVDIAKGQVLLDKGQIVLEDIYLQKGKSKVYLSGQTGLEVETDLEIMGKDLDLSDLKIINTLLPADLKDPKGSVGLDLKISGRLKEILSPSSLLDLEAVGGIHLKEAQLSGVKIREASMEASYRNKEFSIENAWIKTERSDLALNMIMKQQKILSLALSGEFDLDDFIPLSQHLGDLRGKGKVDLYVMEEKDATIIQAEYSINDFRFNQIRFDQIKGGIKTKNEALLLDPATTFIWGQNKFKLSGYAYLKEDFEQSFLNLKLELEKGSLQDVVDYGIYLDQELSNIVLPVESRPIKIDLKGVSFPQLKSRILYSTDGIKDYFLKRWAEVEESLKEYKSSFEPPVFSRMEGQLKGQLLLFGYIDELQGKAKVQVKKVSYGKYVCDQIETEFIIDAQKIEVEKMILAKKGGRLNLFGTYEFKSQALSGKIFAKNYPLDILTLLVDREYDGRFNLAGRFMGTLANPSISIDLRSENLKLDKVPFDRFNLLLSFSDRIFQIEKAELLNGRQKSTLQGFYALGGEADLKFILKGKSLALINLLTDQVRFVDGNVEGNLHYYNSKGESGLDGDLLLDNGILFVKILESYVEKANLKLKAEKGRIEIPEIFAYWQGRHTKYRLNSILAAGTIDLNSGSMAFSLADSEYSIDFPKLYSGKFTLDKIVLQGPIYRPTLSGKVKLKDGSVILPSFAPQKGKKEERAFDIIFGLDLVLQKSVYLSTGNIMTLEMSNIFMNLEMLSDELHLGGSLLRPTLGGRVDFRKGMVSVFNRDFVLLSKKEQEKYFAYDYAMLSDNYAKFSGVSLFPYINITARVLVDDYEYDAEGKRIRKEVQIISFISGKVGEEKEEEAVKIRFIPYIKTEGGMARVGYSDQEVKILLLPDFVKQAAGVEGEGVDANVVLADYLNSRIQTFVFRGIERQLEETLGLESLTLEYNFGREIRQALGGQDLDMPDEPTWGVGVVKGFFDKFYIDLKYRQAVDPQTEAERMAYINYELTYKLTPTWSLAYYREPLTFEKLWSGYEKITLKSGYRF